MYAVEEPETEPIIPLHIHLQCAERFEVVGGQLGVILDGERRLLGIGEEIFIPPGQLQTYWETVFGLAEDGKVGKNGLPNLLQLAVLVPLADSYDPKIPLPLMKLMIGVLGGIGRLLGYKASYPQYSSGSDSHFLT